MTHLLNSITSNKIFKKMTIITFSDRDFHRTLLQLTYLIEVLNKILLNCYDNCHKYNNASFFSITSEVLIEKHIRFPKKSTVTFVRSNFGISFVSSL